MSTVLLEAQARLDLGKGASRRLRRLENKVPAIIYGGTKKAQSIYFLHNKVVKALETESIYSSVFEISVDGKSEQVILKDLQRHPYKPIILHMDLQRISAQDVLVRMIPLHFTNEEVSKGVKAGGIINHNMTQVEVRCKANVLPEFIEIDMADVELDDVVHLFDIKLPKGVELTVDVKDASHNAPIVSIHMPRVIIEEEVEPAVSEEEVPTVGSEEKASEDNNAENAE